MLCMYAYLLILCFLLEVYYLESSFLITKQRVHTQSRVRVLQTSLEDERTQTNTSG